MAVTNSHQLPEIDLDRYNIPGLLRDIEEIVKISRVAGTVARWLLVAPVIGGWILWNVFGGLPIWFRLPYVGLLIVSLVLAAMGFATFGILRSRIVEVNAAADRVLPTLASIHGDILKVNEGEAAVPTMDLALLILNEIVVPALKDAAVVAGAFAAMTGPPAFLAKRLTSALIGAIQRRLARSIQDEPVIDDTYEPPTPEPGHLLEGVDANDAIAVVLASGLPEGVGEFYAQIHEHFVRIIAGVTNVTVGPAKAVVVVSAAPFVLLFLFGLIFIA